MDYFSFLDLPRKLTIDAADLDRRYRTLSRRLHPDYFQTASAAERRASIEQTSYLNDAYRTLRSEPSRIEYLLALEGMPATGRGGVPAALLEAVFEFNEDLEEARASRRAGAAPGAYAAHLQRARQPIERLRDDHQADLRALAAEWDALVDAGGDGARARAILERLRDRMLERRYIENLLDSIAKDGAP